MLHGIVIGRGADLVHKQLSLFSNRKKSLHGNVIGKSKYRRKYSLKHWSYRQRLIHEVSQSSNISWKDVYKLLNMALDRHQAKLPGKHGRRFVSIVNQSRLAKAVHAMYLRKHGRSSLSINKITKKYKISAPTLYRAYKKEIRENR